MNPEKIKSRVRACLERNELVEAQGLLKSLCAKKPADVDAWHLLGAVNGMLGFSDQAEMCARRVIRLAPNAAAAHNNLVSALLAQGKTGEAGQALEYVLKLAPSDPQTLNNQGTMQLRNKDYESAAGSFRRILALQPDNPEAHNNLGSALLGLARFDEAVSSLERALQLNPAYPDALYNYGQAAYQTGKYEVAMSAYSAALKIQPQHVSALLGIAELYKTGKRFQDAIRCYEAVMKMAPQNTDAYVGYGTMLQKQYLHEQALQYFSRAIAINPGCVDALHCSGASMSELGRMDEAAAFLRRALELEPEFVQARHLLAAIGADAVPEKADPRYITELFDAYAINFEENLVGDLEYSVPQDLQRIVTPLLGEPAGQCDILDLGCGTGLCAPLFKPWSRFMTGVDLSRKMAARAEQRGYYDRMVIADIMEPLREAQDQYDLILSADVFIYVGRLEEVFAACSHALRKGGMLAFSIEVLDDNARDYHLHAGGRYAQSRAYIERLAAESGLSVLVASDTVLRKERGEAARGVIYVLGRPG